jgi:hypothetical protein
MARTNTKKPGALVKLYRRRKPGLGIILEVQTTNQIRQFTRDRFKIRFKAIQKIRERIGYNKLYEYRRKGIVTEEQVKMIHAFFLYGKEDRNRRMARIQWITKPSAWETATVSNQVDWYPLDMLRTVSAVKP